MLVDDLERWQSSQQILSVFATRMVAENVEVPERWHQASNSARLLVFATWLVAGNVEVPERWQSRHRLTVNTACFLVFTTMLVAALTVSCPTRVFTFGKILRHFYPCYHVNTWFHTISALLRAGNQPKALSGYSSTTHDCPNSVR